MFDLPDSWVWDFWFADDGDRYYLFFLYASRALHDPDRRHLRASIGHAVSSDLFSWTRTEDALVRGDAPAFDEVATWTGSVVRGDDGLWRLFYTGVRFEEGRNVQRLGCALPDAAVDLALQQQRVQHRSGIVTSAFICSVIEMCALCSPKPV